MTVHANAHRIGNARMHRAMHTTNERTTHMTTTERPIHLYVRVAGHAGVWELDGPAHVLTDDDMFEHPTLVLVHQVADPGRWAVVEGSDVTPFTPTAITTDEAVA